MYIYKATRIKFGLADDSGTEHAINGKKYAVEAQKVFFAADGQSAVISILFDSNENGLTVPNEILLPISTDGSSTQTTIYNLTLNQIFTATGNPYAFYAGTDTSPPCAPNIPWIISLPIKQLTPETVRIVLLFKNLLTVQFICR